VAVHFIANALSKKMEQQQKEQARKAILLSMYEGLNGTALVVMKTI
jgi:hypothetical protein